MYCIKPLRLSNFRTVLEMLEEDGVENGAGYAAPPRMASDGSWRSSDQVQYAFDSIAASGVYVPPDRLSALYGEVPPADREAGAGATKSRREPPRRKSDKETVAEELRLHAGLTRGDLRRIRRDFALRNHPDRVPPWCRDEANQRMTIANTLIDRALKERAVSGGNS